MEKRIYGVLGVSTIMSNWNADFSGYPKSTSDGEVFGSDKALKYPIKKMWENNGEKVVYIKSMRLSEDKKKDITSLVPRSLKERYEQLFDIANLKDCKDTSEVLKNLFSAIDVKNFGATFAEEGNNISITGAVQIGQGFNKYEGISVEEQQILSPFRDGSKDAVKDEEAKNSTLGTKIVSKEAHYVYPFVINPSAYNGFVKLGVTEGYTEDDYMKFKEASKSAVTAYATNAKVGCENELAIYIETEKDLYLPNLSEYVTFRKAEKNVISLQFDKLLNEVKDQILSVEIYYNPYTTVVEQEINGAKLYNIFTNKEV
ncbi:MAG: type I CRISPR-associated protein Cas7 [bacterium]|nr:type I CRISPR-associated protein Cas7 [bacterium]